MLRAIRYVPREGGDIAVPWMTVICALGHSVVAGFDGLAFPSCPSDGWPLNCVSASGRQFPQQEITGQSPYWPKWYLASHHVSLANRLEPTLGPLWIWNQGVQGLTSAGLLNRVEKDQDFAEGWEICQPDTVTIHIGENDQTPDPAPLYDLINVFDQQYMIPRDRIYLATPMRVGWPSVIREIVATSGIMPGPDFSDFLEHSEWMSHSSVWHPNVLGHEEMALRWAECLLGQPTPTPAPPPTFQDDFNRPDGPLGQRWIIPQGSASIQGNECRPGGNTTLLVASGISGSDQRVAATFKREGGYPTFGLLLRYQGPGNANYYSVYRDSTSVRVGRYAGGFSVLGVWQTSIAAIGQPFTLEAEMIGNTITVKLNGAPVLTAQDAANAFQAGGAGVFTTGNGYSQHIDNVSIQML